MEGSVGEPHPQPTTPVGETGAEYMTVRMQCLCLKNFPLS